MVNYFALSKTPKQFHFTEKIHWIFNGCSFAGSASLFFERLHQLKTFIKPCGYEHHRKLIESISLFNEAQLSGNFSAVLGVYHRSIILSRILASHMQSQAMTASANFMIDECEKVMGKIKADKCGYKQFQELAISTMAKLRDEF